MISKMTKRLVLTTAYSRRLNLLVASVACFYLLITALLTLCLVHPPNGHAHSDADGHFHLICVWVQKGIASHAPSARVILPVVEATLFLLLSFPLLVPHIRAVQLTGRSPPNTPLFA
jgi:hypothetical protein